MAISASDVAKLRKATLAGMMDCKKALEEAEGNFDKAVEIIRKKGQAVANKRADRDATEGVTIAKTNDDNTFGALIVLNSETDFVAKNADFQNLAAKILDIAIANKPADLNALKALPMEGATVAEKVTEYIGIIGEKLDLAAYEKVAAPYVQAYIHPGNQRTAVVGFNKAGVDVQVYKDIAMQVVSMSPIAIDEPSVPKEVVDKEFELGLSKTKLELTEKAVQAALTKAGYNLYISENEEHINEGIMKGYITEAQADDIRRIKKEVAEEAAANIPEQKLQNIAKGRINKFFKEKTLVNQEFWKDSKQTVAQYLKASDKDLAVTAFQSYDLKQ